MGTTPNLAFPYPDASLPIGLANEHQQELAEYLDDWFSPECLVERAAVTAEGTVVWTASPILRSFALGTQSVANDCVVYTGPTRRFLFHTNHRWTTTGDGQLRYWTVLKNGAFAELAGEYYVKFSPCHVASGIVELASGDKVGLGLAADGVVDTFHTVQFRIKAI